MGTQNQRPTQNQPIGYYDQVPVMNWGHAVSWGRGVWVSVSDIDRVGQPELKHKTKHIRIDKIRNPTPEHPKDHFARSVIRAPNSRHAQCLGNAIKYEYEEFLRNF